MLLALDDLDEFDGLAAARVARIELAASERSALFVPNNLDQGALPCVRSSTHFRAAHGELFLNAGCMFGARPARLPRLGQVHRQTIAAYDLGAEHWSRSRYNNRSGVEANTAAARAFRQQVGDGLILDIGSGPGRLLDALGTPSIGLDASTAMLALGRSERTGPFLAADAEALPVGRTTVAGFFANWCLQHLPRTGLAVALGEIHRVLQPAGLLYVAMHLGDSDDGVRVNDDVPPGAGSPTGIPGVGSSSPPGWLRDRERGQFGVCPASDRATPPLNDQPYPSTPTPQNRHWALRRASHQTSCGRVAVGLWREREGGSVQLEAVIEED